MTPKTVFSPEPHKGWLPWGMLSPFLCIAFVIVSVLATSPWMEAQGFETPKGEPIGLLGWYAFLVIPFALNGLLILAWVRFVERRPLSTIGLTGGKSSLALLPGVLIGATMILALVAAVGLAGGYSPGAVAPAI
eukprot:gene2476-3349_t